ncbi:MAG: hypothetical protein J6A60_01180 [Clostridia bacterium]|nr:hypothetical protein [Clostridia bacterium]
MKITVKRASVIYILILAFLAGVVLLMSDIVTKGEEWATGKLSRHFSYETDISEIIDLNGTVLVSNQNADRIYIDDPAIRTATLHVIGDRLGKIDTGIGTLYNSIPDGYNIVDGIYNLRGDDLGGAATVTLNIDSKANLVAYNALKDYKGAVAVLNYETGQLLCSVSTPCFDPENTPADLDKNTEKYDGVYIDRVTRGTYTPGSIMKIVTAACAIENIPDLYTRSFNCEGKYKTGDGTVICNGTHGEQSFEKAMNNSCNCAFAEISIELGAEKLQEYAESLGFNQTLYAGEIRLTTSYFTPSKISKTELGWAGIGQSTTRVTPAYFLSLCGAIANGGTGYAPDRLMRFDTSAGKEIIRSPKAIVNINPDTAEKLVALLRSNVRDKYGDNRFPGLEMCGKTGTAQLDGKDSHSWFVGFTQKEGLPLAIVCIAENGGWGSQAATEIANAVMQYFAQNYSY